VPATDTPPSTVERLRARASGRIGALALVLLAFGLAGLTIAGGLGLKHRRVARDTTAAAMARARDDSARSAAAIDARLAGVMPSIAAAAADLAPAGLTEAAIVARLEAVAARTPAARGVGVAYAPSAVGGRRLFAPYVVRNADHTTRRVDLAATVDYTTFAHRWYGDTLLDGAAWHEPVDGLASEGRIAIYSVPLFRPGADPVRDAPVGVVFAAVALDDIARVLDGLSLGTNGYAFVFSSEGHYVAHPRRDLVARDVTVFDTAWAKGDTALHSAAIRSLRGERGLIEEIDPSTGQASWLAYVPLKSSGWTLAVVYFADAILLNPDRERRDVFRITGAAVMGVGMMGMGLFVLLINSRASSLWTVAISMSCVVAAGIVGLWWVSSRFPSTQADARTPVLDIASAEQYLRAYQRDSGRRRLDEIPTGIFVRSIEFLSSTNVAITGSIWQRIPAGAPAQFILADADKPEIREVSRRRAGAEDLVLWSFSASLREPFPYDKYPFDQQAVWVRLRPSTLDRGVVLIPDLGAYTVTNPAARPGVASDLVLPGWALVSSYFDYDAPDFNANFGYEQFDASAALPDLYFNVKVSRRFLGPFVSNVIPLTVASIMIFSLLLISSKSQTHSRFAGFTAKDTVSGAAAVFFVISYQHITLRNALASPRLIYLEYFYFTTYLALLAVMLNGILFARSDGGPILEFRDNLVPKIAYWPTVMTFLFVLTLWVFY
jgi:hypothetical protein